MNIEKKDNDLTNIRRFSPSKAMIQFDYDFTRVINLQFSVPSYRLLESKIISVDTVMSDIAGIKPVIERAINEYEY